MGTRSWVEPVVLVSVMIPYHLLVSYIIFLEIAAPERPTPFSLSTQLSTKHCPVLKWYINSQS